MQLFSKKGAPWRRVIQTIRVAEGQFYDQLECGHRESHDVLSKKRRCRTCAHPAFPGISIAPQSVQPGIVAAKDGSETAASPSPASATASVPIPLVLTVEEVADLLRVNRKTVYDAAARGEIPGVRRIGNRTLRFYGPALARWLETGTGAKAGRAGRR
jgi:excisionase family DNA binding protein